MRIVKPLAANIVELLQHYEQNGHLIMQASLLGKQSVVYKLQEYCLKVYTPRGKVGGEIECEAILSLQNNRHVPRLYAYSAGRFVLTEWIEAFDLRQYREVYGHIPHNLIYDMFSTELQQVQSGYRDWEVMRYANLLWAEGGDVKRTDFWLCEPVGSMRENVEKEIIQKFDKVLNGDRTEIEKLEHYFYRHGLTPLEVQVALGNFRSRTSSQGLIR